MVSKLSPKERYLQGNLLIATPNVSGSCFSRSVIYMCSHTDDGAMGMIINNQIPHIDSREILEQLDIKLDDGIPDIPIHFGGPVDPARGFVIHSAEYKTTDTVNIDDSISITSNADVLRDLAKGRGPHHSILVLGYSGWEAGQVEQEIEDNSWLVVPATNALIFGDENEMKWDLAANSLGVDMNKLSTTAGHA